MIENYVALSIETHLFFARIMKEHALFLEAGFPCKNEAWIQKADWFREEFENLLREIVKMSNGKVDDRILKSCELVTEFTIPAEKRTEHLSGISIDSEISMMQQKLQSGCDKEVNKSIHEINKRAVYLLNGLIDFKENILEGIEKGKLYNTNYSLLIKHITREARLYKAIVEELLYDKRISHQKCRDMEVFWNQIMMEHALFIRGLLDPSEEALIETADEFAREYKELLEMAKRQDCRAMESIKKKSLAETLKYREFKTAGAEGILECKIASIILPLLADHVLREANHYIRILECGYKN